MELRLKNEKPHFWQWDTGQVINVRGLGKCNFALLSNVPNGTALRVPIVDEGGTRTVAVPDILLQQAEPIVVHLCQREEDGGTTTNHSQRFPVLARAKPDDYVYTAEEIKTWEDLAQRVTSLEKSGGGADWDQNDATAAGYVKNRPFYTDDPREVAIIPEMSVAFEPDSGETTTWAAVTAGQAIVVGNTYKVEWDGTLYECAGVSLNGTPVIGNPAIYWHNLGAEEDNGLPFCIYEDSGVLWSGVVTPAAATTVTIRAITVRSEIHKIDHKYLPDNMVLRNAYMADVISAPAVFNCLGVTLFDFGGTQTGEREVTQEQWDEAFGVANLVSLGSAHFVDDNYLIGCITSGRKVTLNKWYFDWQGSNFLAVNYTTVFSYDSESKRATAKYTRIEKIIS